MKWTFIPSVLTVLIATMATTPPVHAQHLMSIPVFRIDFEHVKAFRAVADVQGTEFSLTERGDRSGPGSLALSSVEKPAALDPLSRSLDERAISEKYGDIEGHFLRIDGFSGSTEVALTLRRRSRVVTFDYVLSNSVRRTDPFDYLFICRYSSGTTDRYPVRVANPPRLAERTRGKVTCSAPENAYVQSIVFSNATDGSYETWVDNIVGERNIQSARWKIRARR
ncbi:hypothetical protein C8J98_102485 [Luteibacter sp. OK325]|uniref:hypothetical protein n=1 Tax=Luteibacter sp. OK325 TaxID=2135670 RepID=UPI000D36BDD9|nr:hypothetical protein [Luteibacter sp. OK325]PTR34297.1 hypothetical protein C8J98_102485 [Luteibacter sp. OK325]